MNINVFNKSLRIQIENGKNCGKRTDIGNSGRVDNEVKNK